MNVLAPAKRIRAVIRRRGFLGTIAKLPEAIWHLSREQISPARRRARRQLLESDNKWDNDHGIDTAGATSLSVLTGCGSSWLHGERYEPSKFHDFHRILGLVPIRHEDLTFIDVGSGKGRALILAAQYRFKRIVGIEFMPELHQIALKNIGVLRLDDRIETINIDALNYPLPADPLIIYLYNPLNSNVMDPFVRRVEESLRAVPRSIWILYVNAEHASAWDTSPYFRRVAVIADSDQLVVWQSIAQSAVVTTSLDLSVRQNHESH